LYYRAISRGIFSGSKTDLTVRSILNNEYKKLGPEHMFSKLEQIDPAYSKKVHINNKKRLIRALEIYKTTGRTPSEHFNMQRKSEKPALNLFTVLLKIDKKTLYDRIKIRTNKMINDGWIDETKKLIKNRKKIEMHPIDSIGYKQIIAYIDGEFSKKELIDEIIIRTGQYAKKQIKWFRNEKIDLEIKMSVSSDAIVNKIIKKFYDIKN
jgi:tRNA delta(2)-isopentenylpyrophosphate transferase